MIFFMIFMQLIFPINILIRKFIHTDILRYSSFSNCHIGFNCVTFRNFPFPCFSSPIKKKSSV